MDIAVALVQSYLHANGYLTVTEYPLVEATKGGVRSRTDLDIIAFRFPHGSAGHRKRLTGDDAPEPDPALHVPPDCPDMIIGEVKEGAARFNEAMRDPRVLRAALTRFGCCEGQLVDGVVQQLIDRGQAITPEGHQVRMVVFGTGGREGKRLPDELVVELGHVLRFLQGHIAAHRAVFRAARSHDDILAFLTILDKAGLEPYAAT